VTYDGIPIPPWDMVGDEVRRGWDAAAQAVIEDRDALRIAVDAVVRRRYERALLVLAYDVNGSSKRPNGERVGSGTPEWVEAKFEFWIVDSEPRGYASVYRTDGGGRMIVPAWYVVPASDAAEPEAKRRYAGKVVGSRTVLYRGEEFAVAMTFPESKTLVLSNDRLPWSARIEAWEVVELTDTMCKTKVPVNRGVNSGGPTHLVCNQERGHGGPRMAPAVKPKITARQQSRLRACAAGPQVYGTDSSGTVLGVEKHTAHALYARGLVYIDFRRGVVTISPAGLAALNT
jgi:hypothetical protein